MFNPGLQFDDEQAFVNYILAEQPEAPKYFAVMKRVNKEGPALLGPPQLPKQLDTDLLCDTVAKEMVVDTRNDRAFGQAHVEGTINIKLKYVPIWGGSLLDYDKPVYLISSDELPDAVRLLHKVGMDNIGGYFCANEVAEGGFNTQHIPQEAPEQVIERFKAGELEIIDVRGITERHKEFIPGSAHVFLAKMLEEAKRFAASDKVHVFQCRTGPRSMIAASIAQRAGAKHVINLDGGIEAWKRAGFPVDSEVPQTIET